MQSSPIISFRNIDRSEQLEELIHQQIGRLEKVYPRIVDCEVVIHGPQKRRTTGREVNVKITVRVPGPDIHVERSVGKGEEQQDITLALHRAFDAARRELRERVKKMARVEVKPHPPVLHGRIDRLFEGEGYGFISADDGRDVYFDRESLTTGSWDQLRVDMKVRFREETGDKGPFATNIAAISPGGQ